jgi:hypothetical protein
MSPLFLRCLVLFFWVKACIEIGDRVLRFLCYLDLNAKILVFYLFETIFVCFLSIFYNLAHSRIKGTSLLRMVVLGIDFGIILVLLHRI